jgi:hypothetical protein
MDEGHAIVILLMGVEGHIEASLNQKDFTGLHGGSGLFLIGCLAFRRTKIITFYYFSRFL